MIQLASILEDFANPKLTNTMVEKKKLEDFVFPLLFKICPTPAFNGTALKEYGYENAATYFKGASMFNRSMVGWGGHTNGTLEAQASVEEVYAKVKNYEVEDIIDSIHIFFQGSLLFQNGCFYTLWETLYVSSKFLFYIFGTHLTIKDIKKNTNLPKNVKVNLSLQDCVKPGGG